MAMKRNALASLTIAIAALLVLVPDDLVMSVGQRFQKQTTESLASSTQVILPLLAPNPGQGYNPGIYAFQDFGFEDPNVYPFLKGATFHVKWLSADSNGWDYTNPSATPPLYSIEWLIRQVAGDRNGNGGQTRPDGNKMKVMLNITLHDGEAERVDPIYNKLGDQTPDWVYNKFMVPKIRFDVGLERFQFPKYTDGIDPDGRIVGRMRYLEAIESMVSNLSVYDGDPRVEQVWVAGGVWGESAPYPWFKEPQAGDAFLQAGVTPAAWETYISQLIAVYRKHFTQTPLYFSPGWHDRAVAEHKRVIADDAVRQGLHIAAHYLSTEPDKPYFALAGWDPAGYLERWSWIRDYVQDAVGIPERRRLYVESGANDEILNPDPHIAEAYSYWEALMALDKRADYLGLYSDQSRNPNLAAVYYFFNDYAGKALVDTPGVWIAFRKESPGKWQPQKDGTYTVTVDSPSGLVTRAITIYANYGEWLTQLDPDNTTVPLWNVGGKEGMFARRTDLASGKTAFALLVDDGYMAPSPNARFNTTTAGVPARISVTFLDSGGGTFGVRYDAFNDANKLAGTVAKSDSGAWKTAAFSVPDAFFGGRSSNADLRIEALTSDVILHMVEIRAGQ